MSLFKVSKTNSELVPSSALDTQCSVIEEENILNSQSKSLCKNLGGNDIELIISNKDNEAPAKTYSRKEINIFYSKIKLIRKKYNIKKSRKNHIDSLVKKAKSKFLKAIYECLKYCLHSCNLSRLPQKFIINTRIEYNKKVLNKTVEEIYTGFKLLPTYETLMQNNQVYKNRQEFLYSLMKTKLKDIYKYYISSNLYTIDKKRIESKSGEGVVKLYDFVATNICEYFLLNKGNDKRLNRWRNNGNAKKLFVKKKRFEIQKKVENNNNNSSINNININNNKNIYIKFNILKLDNNNINTKSKNSNEN
jgi:hypothetical protein